MKLKEDGEGIIGTPISNSEGTGTMSPDDIQLPMRKQKKVFKRVSPVQFARIKNGKPTSEDADMLKRLKENQDFKELGLKFFLTTPCVKQIIEV